MKVTVISDLHLEFDHKPTLKLAGGDILLLAGDVVVAAHTKSNRTDKDARKHTKTYRAFFDEECAKFKKVYYILGNHEHYRGVFDYTAELMLRFLENTNVTLLNNQFVDLGDWNLFAGTLWTDYNNNDWTAKTVAKNSMSDHHVIGMMRGGVQGNFVPDDAYEEHHRTLMALENGLFAPHLTPGKQTVVMTHHAPTSKSVHSRYAGDILNYAYYTDLSNTILDFPNIKYWFHGHTHDSHDYMVGDHCRVVCNPRGYAGHEENPNFNPTLTIEL